MLYEEAARILQLVESKQGSAKNLTFLSTYKVCVHLLLKILFRDNIILQLFDTIGWAG